MDDLGPWILYISDSLEEKLVYVAPAPFLARLERANDRVLGGVKVAGGVLVL
jgi:hypothetical protein